jgi:hypothetical protein
VSNVLEVTGETTLQSNLKVADNINVGNLTADEMKKANNGGYIVAKQDIIAKHDIIAENNATITNKLTSGSLSTGAAGATSLTVTEHSTLATASVEQLDSGLTVTEGLALGTITEIVGQVPALELKTQENGSVRLCFNFGTTIAPAE